MGDDCDDYLMAHYPPCPACGRHGSHMHKFGRGLAAAEVAHSAGCTDHVCAGCATPTEPATKGGTTT